MEGIPRLWHDCSPSSVENRGSEADRTPLSLGEQLRDHELRAVQDEPPAVVREGHSSEAVGGRERHIMCREGSGGGIVCSSVREGGISLCRQWPGEGR